MLATICEDTWNELNKQHITPNKKDETPTPNPIGVVVGSFSKACEQSLKFMRSEGHSQI